MAEKVCIVGSGNWGSAIARIVGSNAAANDLFASSVNMWTFEEDIDGKKLTEIINTTHENVKYLPGCTLPSNVVAVPDLATAAADATILIFVLPHQFLPRLMPVIKTAMASNARAISLIKGIDFDSSGIRLISQSIATELGVSCSVLMGANVANEVAKDEFSEATIGLSSGCGTGDGDVLRSLFNTDSFSIRVVDDVMGVELCGALKNIVALGAGFVDGLGLGGNTKAAIIRIGLSEMMRFSKRFYPSVQDSTFFESSGIADLITTCYGGRNRKCAEEFVRRGDTRGWDAIEKDLLGGQKLQGTLTSQELQLVLQREGAEIEFPFFDTVNKIAFHGLDAAEITKTAARGKQA